MCELEANSANLLVLNRYYSYMRLSEVSWDIGKVSLLFKLLVVVYPDRSSRVFLPLIFASANALICSCSGREPTSIASGATIIDEITLGKF